MGVLDGTAALADLKGASFDARLENWIAAVLPGLVPARYALPVDLRPIVVSLAEHGLLAAGWPAPFGANDADLQLRLHRRLAGQPHGAVGIGVLSQVDITARILREHGNSDYLKERMRAALAGRNIMALGLTEPEGGSDLRGIDTTAVKTEAGWRLNGAKWGVTNLAIADSVIVLTRSSESRRPLDGFTLLLVARDLPGVTIGPPMDTAGHPGALGEAVFTDVLVPHEAVIGNPGQGMLHMMLSLAYERVMIASRALGACEAMLAEAVAHCRARKTFGTRLIDNQYIQFQLANWRSGILGLEAEMEAVWAGVRASEPDTGQSASLKYTAAIGSICRGYPWRAVPTK